MTQATLAIGGYFKALAPSTNTSELYPLHAYIDTPSLVPEDGLEGRCPLCGHLARFTEYSENLRETGICSSCQSSNRQRQMAFMVRARLGLPAAAQLAFPKAFSIYNVEANGALHGALKNHGNYICSEYFGDEYAPGATVNGIRHEDLQHLSFASGQFDLMLSSDVLEHMPDPYAAHREIFRVLRPGGRHIFTVPFRSDTVQDDVRAILEDGKIKYLDEALYHGDPVRPNEGILVWTIFGVEMMRKLEEIGFEVRAWHLYEPSAGIVGNNNTIFEALKPGPSRQNDMVYVLSQPVNSSEITFIQRIKRRARAYAARLRASPVTASTER